MSKTETKTARAVELELPPEGGNLSVVSSLEEDAHYLRVTLDKAENFKVAAGKRLLDLLVNKFGNNRNALRDWYEENVAEGKANRSWSTVEEYLVVVRKYDDATAATIFSQREERRREDKLKYHAKIRNIVSGRATENENKSSTTTTTRSEYDIRQAWLSDMNVLWFKGEREWQDRWLQDRALSRDRQF